MSNTLDNKSALYQNFKFAVCDCIMCQSKNRWQPQNAIKSTGDYQIDALNSGYRWSSTTITYSFFTNGSTYYGSETGVSQLMEATKANIRTVLEQLYEPLINVNFVEVPDSTNSYGNLRFMYSNGPSYAYAYYPSDFWAVGGDVHLSQYYESDTWNGFSYEPGNHGFMTLIHEIGHAMGLKHPGNYWNNTEPGPYLPYGDDNTTNTVMSYHFTNPAANLMTYDLKTLQYLYGAKAKNPTDTTYTFSKQDKYSTGSENSIASSKTLKILIYDSGGTDTLDFSNLPFNSSGYRFDIRENGIITTQNDYNTASYYSRESGQGPFYTSKSGTRIAFNTSLENVVNSTSDDYIIANPAANTFSGYNPNRSTGRDTIEGANNLDILDLSSYISSNVTQTQNGNNLVLGLSTNRTVTIKDYYAVSEPQRLQIQLGAVIVPEIAIADVSLNEGSSGTTTNANFIVTLSSSTSESIIVEYATTDGSADSSSDYLATSGSLTFNPGETQRTLVVNVVGDTTIEADETFNVNLNGATGATISDSLGVGTIQNDDFPTLSIADVSLSEGNTGNQPFNFVVQLSNSSPTEVTVNFATADVDAIAPEDYLATSGIVSFAPGETQKTISVNVVSDSLIEVDETFNLNISTPVGVTITDGQGIGTILNDDYPPLSITNVSETEGNAGDKPFNFVVQLSTPAPTPLKINYATSNGTARTTDYQNTWGSVSFSIGETIKTVAINVKGDSTIEADETFYLTLSDPSGAAIPSGQGLGTILNDDFPTTISISDVSLAEGNTGTKPFDFVVALSTPAATPVKVNYATSNGTARTTDYQSTWGSVSFSVGETIKTVGINVTGDTTIEADETFNVNLSGAVGATITDNLGVGSILNDDYPPLSITNVSSTEGNAGDKPFNFVVQLSTPAPTPLKINYATSNGTARTTDYQNTWGSVSFSIGETIKTVAINVKGDTTIEPDETFYLTLSDPSGAAIPSGQGLGTILNDDFPTTISISDVSLAEGNTGTKSFDFVVALSTPAATPVRVNYATSNGTARTTDYQSTWGSLSFSVGETIKTVAINVTGDTTIEADETFNVNLSGAVGATITDNLGVGSILNDDYPPLSITNVSETEGNAGNKPFNFVVQLSTPAPTPLKINYATSNGTARTTDYQNTWGSVSFSIGETIKTVAINVKGDSTIEADETFYLTLSDPSGAAIPSGQGLGTILNDDFPTTISISDVSLAEGNTGTKPFNFVVRLSTPAATPVRVNYATSNGTARTTDYQSTWGSLSFSVGETIKTVGINVTGDTTIEADETFNVNLSGAVGATISDTLGLGTIVNDDTTNNTLQLQKDQLLGAVKTITGSVGIDTFTLGDASGAYYASNGNQDYALLVNFEQSKDRIQLHGSANDYDISNGGLGAEIFLNKTELIGIVAGVNQVDSLSLSFV